MSSAETTEHAQSSGNVPAVVIFSATLGKFVETIGKWGALFMLPLVFITVWDVLQRKTMTFIGNWMLANDYLAARDWMYGTLLNCYRSGQRSCKNWSGTSTSASTRSCSGMGISTIVTCGSTLFAKN